MMPVILFTAGTVRISFKRYILLNVLGEIIWTGGLMVVGFFFSFAEMRVEGVLGKLSLASLVAIGGIAFMYLIRDFKHRLLR